MDVSRWLGALAAWGILSLVPVARAQSPDGTFAYSGRLVGAEGRPLAGAVDLEVSLHDQATGGAALGGTQSFAATPVADGTFTVALTLPDGVDPGGVWVQVRDVTSGRLYPRQKLGAVPFALRTPVDGTTLRYVDGKLEVGAVPPGGVVELRGQPVSATAPTTAGQVLKWSGSEWYAGPDEGGVTGAISSGVSLGAGGAGTAQVFADVAAPAMRFRRLKEGTGIALTEGADEITIGVGAHAHGIADVTGLQTALDGKAALAHNHAIADTTGLQTALDGKAALAHNHAIADTTGLQTALDGKAALAHGHAIADVTGLQTALDGKAALSHNHAIADVTGLQTALDGKAATSHAHSAADITSGALALARLDAAGCLDGEVLLRAAGGWTCEPIGAANASIAEIATATTAPLALYVDPLGDDANACTSTGAAACRTIMGAVDKIPRYIRHAVTVTIANGTYGELVEIGGFTLRGGSLQLIPGGSGYTVDGGGVRTIGITVNGLTGRGQVLISGATITDAIDHNIIISASPLLVHLENVTATNGKYGIAVVNGSRARTRGTVSVTGATVAGVGVYEASAFHYEGALSVTGNNTGIHLQNFGSLASAGGSLNASGNTGAGVLLNRSSVWVDVIGSVTVNGNGGNGLAVGEASYAELIWATGGSGIRIGTVASPNGTAASGHSGAIELRSGGRLNLRGSSTSRATVRSLNSSGVFGAGNTVVDLHFADVNSNGVSGVVIRDQSNGYLTDVTASSNGGTAVDVDTGSSVTALGTAFTASSNAAGVGVARGSFLRFLATTSTLANNTTSGLSVHQSKVLLNNTVNISGSGTNGVYLAVDASGWLSQGATLSVTGSGAHGIVLRTQSRWFHQGALNISGNTGGAINIYHQSSYLQEGTCPSCSGATSVTGQSFLNRNSVSPVPSVTADATSSSI